MTIDVFRQTLANSMLDMHLIRSDIRSILAEGNAVDEQTHAEFEAAIAQSVEELRPHVIDGEVPELAKLWQQYNVEMILNFQGRTTVRKKSGCDNEYGIAVNGEVREIHRIDMPKLLAVSRLLDRISKKLGLMTDTSPAGRSSGRLT